MNGENDPRYATEKSTMNLRQTASSLEKITHKFTRELNELSGNAEHLKYKSYVEERNNCRSGSDPRYHTSSVRQELRDTLSKLQKATHNFVREHDDLANRAEYLKYTDFVRQQTDPTKRNKSI